MADIEQTISRVQALANELEGLRKEVERVAESILSNALIVDRIEADIISACAELQWIREDLEKLEDFVEPREAQKE